MFNIDFLSKSLWEYCVCVCVSVFIALWVIDRRLISNKIFYCLFDVFHKMGTN